MAGVKVVIFSLVLALAVFGYNSSPLPEGEVEPRRRGDIEINPDDYEDYSDYYKEDYDEDSERGVFSVIKVVAKGVMKGAKLVGSAVIKGGSKIIKSGVMKTGKKLVWKGTKKVVKVTAEAAAGMALEAGIDALTPAEDLEEGEDYEEVEEQDLFEYLGEDSFCSCNTTHECVCCVEVPEFEEACLTITLLKGGSLWNKDAEVRIRTTYGGERTFNYKYPVKGFDRTCRQLSEEMGNIKMCVTSLGREKVDSNQQKQCFSMEFNGHSFLKCIIQNKNKKLEMGL